MNKLINSLGTPMTQEQYAQEWKVDAEHISNDGHHAWMAEQLGPQDLVVEIGCGAGASTLALARKSRVICVESNSNLVELCKNNLLANEVSVQVVSLSELAQVTSQVAIVNGDVFDVAVEEYLKIVRPAAIVCWLIGAAPETIAKNIGKNLGDFTGGEMAAYRQKLHKRVYELGESILQVEGVVHIVDRIGIRSWSEKDSARTALVEMHGELAGASYLVGKNNAYLRRTPKGVSRSSISMMSVDRFDNAIEALSSVKALRSE